MLNCEKWPFLREFLDEPDAPIVIWVAPWGMIWVKGQEFCQTSTKHTQPVKNVDISHKKDYKGDCYKSTPDKTAIFKNPI